MLILLLKKTKMGNHFLRIFNYRVKMNIIRREFQVKIREHVLMLVEKIRALFSKFIMGLQIIVFNIIFLYSSVKGLYTFETKIRFPVEKFKWNFFNFNYVYEFFFKYKLVTFYTKARYALWLLVSLPWIQNTNVKQLDPITETTSYPYSWLKTTDICNILYKNTNFFQICAERQQLVDVQLKENLPYYLYLTNTEVYVGPFTKQFLGELEPYYYKLVMHCLKAEHGRDPLVYVRFAIDPHFRQLFFTQVSNDYLSLAKLKLSEIPIIEYITQKLSLEAELRERLNYEIPVASSYSFSTSIDLLYTICIEHFYLYFLYPSKFSLQDILQLPVGKLLGKFDTIFTVTLPHLWCIGFIIGLVYFCFALEDFSGRKVYIVRDWWMRIRYFFLTTLNLDIQGEDKDFWFFFALTGIAPIYFCDYIFTFRVNDLRDFLKSHGLPCTPRGAMIEDSSPVYYQSPVLFLLIQNDARNVYYRTGFNRALIRNPELRNSTHRIGDYDFFPVFLDLYPTRSVSTSRFIEYMRLAETGKFSDGASIGEHTLFSGFNGYRPLLANIGGRCCFENGIPYMEIVNKKAKPDAVELNIKRLKKALFKTYTHILDHLVDSNKQAQLIPKRARNFPHLQHAAFMYKSFIEASEYFQVFAQDSKDDRIVSVEDLLYKNSDDESNYDDYVDTHGGEKALQFAVTEMKYYPERLLRRRGYCSFYYSVKDLMYRYPLIFKGFVNINKIHGACHPYYKPMMTNVIADLAQKSQSRITNPYDATRAVVRDILLWFNPYFGVDLKLNLNGPVVDDPRAYLMTYKQLYKALKVTPHLVVLELLNSEWFDFRMYIDPALNFEKLYDKYNYILAEKLTARVALTSTRQTTFDTHVIERTHDKLSKAKKRQRRVVMPTDTFLLTQTLLHRIAHMVEKRELSRHKFSKMSGKFMPIFDKTFGNFPATKQYKQILSKRYIDLEYQYKRRLFYTPLLDIKHSYALDVRTDKLVTDYLHKFELKGRLPRGRRKTYESQYGKYDYDAQFAHDVLMDMEVFDFINKNGIVGDKMFNQALDAMIRRWGKKDPFIQKIEELYQTSRLDAFLALDPKIGRELNAKLKRIDCSIDELYNMSFDEFKLFLDKHRIPTWLVEASVAERVIQRMADQKMYEHLMSDIDLRRFYPSKSNNPPMYNYTMNDIISVQRNTLVSWGDQPAAEVRLVEDGAINYRLLDKKQLLDDISETDMIKKVYGPPLRHLKFLQMYDPKDFAYHREVVETYLHYMTNDLIVRLMPAWINHRLIRYFDIRFTAITSPFLDDYDYRLHNLLQRLEKHFGLAKQLAGHKTRTGRYLCGPKVVEYCELFKFFENMDKILPKLCVGFSKNDDELDLTLDTFTTYTTPTNPVIDAYKLQLPNSALYKDTAIAYQIYAPFTFEELAIVTQKYDSIFVPDYAPKVANEYMNSLCSARLSKCKYKYYSVITPIAEKVLAEEYFYNVPEPALIYSIFPERDEQIVNYAKQQKFEYARLALNYNKLYTRLLPVRRRPERLRVFPMLRYKSRKWSNDNRAKRLAGMRDHGLFLHGSPREYPYLKKLKKRLKLTSFRIKAKYSSENNLLIFPPKVRRHYKRNKRLVRTELRLYKRNRNVQYKNIYLQYLLNKSASQMTRFTNDVLSLCTVDNLTHPNAYLRYTSWKQSSNNFSYTFWKQRFRRRDPVKRLTFWDIDIFPKIQDKLNKTAFKPISMKRYSIRFLRYLNLLKKYKKKLIFIDRKQQIIPVYTHAHELRHWYTIDYIHGLKRIRKHTPDLVKLERGLSKPLRKQLTVWELRQSIFHLFKTFVFNPRIRLLKGYIKAMPRTMLWFPELTGSLLKMLSMRRDLVTLEDIFYILNALNHAAENRRVRSIGFAEFVKAQHEAMRNPKLFLLERVQQNQYYPQEILAEVAKNNPFFVERLLRLRRVLELEYNIHTELLDSIVVTSFTRYRSKKKTFLKLKELTNEELKFLYASKKGEYLPIVPRCIFAAHYDNAVESTVLKACIRGIWQKRRIYFYRYLAPYYPFFETYTQKIRPMEMPFLVINKPLIDNILGIPLLHEYNFLMFKSLKTKLHYWFFTHNKHFVDYSNKYYELYSRFYEKRYSSLYKEILKGKSIYSALKSKRTRQEFRHAYHVYERAKKREVIIKYFVNFFIPVKDFADKNLKPYLNFKSAIKHTKCSVEDFVLNQGDQKLLGLYQDYAKKTEPWGTFMLPKVSRRITAGHNVQLTTRRRNWAKIRYRRKIRVKRNNLEKTTLFPGARVRENIFIFSNFNQLGNASIHNILDEVILTGFYSIAAPKLASNYHQRLLFTGLELSTGQTSFGVWLNWSGGKPVTLWFPIYNNQAMVLSHGAPGLVFLPRLTSYISEDNIIDVSYKTTVENDGETKPFLEHKTVFSFLRWNQKMKERELWLHFFIYEKFNLLPGDLTYDILYTFLYIQLHALELFLKIL